MKDLATAAGVSRPTVSRALKGDPQISPGTTERILRLAEAMGYRRDPAYEVLARERWGGKARFLSTVGFLMHDDLHREGYLRGARACAERLGYAVDAFALEEYPTAGALERALQARGVWGLVLPIFSPKSEFLELDWSRYAVVACNVDAVHLPFHLVRTNVVRKVEIAWEKCRERGYRRIGFVLPHSGPNELDRLRQATSRECLASVAESEAVPIWCERYEQLDNLDVWLGRHQPDAVIVGQPIALRVLDTFARQSRRVIPHCCLLECLGRACLSSRPERIGYVALSVLHQQLMENALGPPEDPFTVVTEPQWIDGPTLPDQRG